MVLCTIRHAHTLVLDQTGYFDLLIFGLTKLHGFVFMPCVETNQVKNQRIFCIFSHMWQLRLEISSIYWLFTYNYYANIDVTVSLLYLDLYAC